jgi:hypothetical protein
MLDRAKMRLYPQSSNRLPPSSRYYSLRGHYSHRYEPARRQPSSPRQGCTGLLHLLQIGHKGLAIFPGHILQAVPDLMDNAPLAFGLRKDGMNRLFEAGQIVNAGNKAVLHAASLEVGENTQPKVGAFCSIAGPVAEHVFVAFQVCTQADLDRNVFYPPLLAQLEVKSVKVDDGIDRRQRAILPGLQQSDRIFKW